jgi:hypothetical protein
MFAIRQVLFVVLVLTVALVAGACDGDDAGGDTTTTTASSAGDAGDGNGNGSTAATTTTGAQQFSGDSGSAWCDRMRAINEDDTILDFTDTTATEVEAQLERAADLYDELERDVPREIEDDFDVVLDAFDKWFERAKELEFDYSAMVDDEAWASAFDNPAVEAAGERLDAYDLDVCGIDG